ncbi:MetS family NSS transporter small subunit [Myceligenerans pegani]|uniref:MetS family NSS transporter small subunit n=1 Tax=Myceligenerans pegani TaxID=2776917 RepID=A0ABR9N093_9MICO|nr:MetS family NSS transporter small subunit [Myceligenerans sp. TRM 65318]MBE1877054.1 MetS family NSS transporter small subunit [Myceligenerans sp. TRM 65318]MBE3019325.1 MetS family NSS transporter small subunit [Myceligenerans sp. TRM 65318]
MNAGAIVLMVVSLLLVWGGLGVSIAMLMSRPERTEWPEGWERDDADA